MRKIRIVISALVVLAFVLALLPACGESATPTPTAKPPTPTAAAAAATPTKAAAAATTAPTAAAAAPTAAPKGDSTGVTDAQIILGTTAPLSGPVSVAGTMAKAMDAYFKYVNDQGGINGRKVVLKIYDDAYQAAKTVQLTKQAVEEDKVFATLGSTGSAAQMGVIDYLNDKKVPQLFVASGVSGFSATPQKYPWTTGGSMPTYADEAVIYAKYILANKPNAKVGIMYQNDDMGKEYWTAFKTALGDKAKTLIVSEQSFESSAADVNSQIANVKAAGADLVFLIPSQGVSAKALSGMGAIGWYPEKIVASSGSGLGAIGVVDKAATKGLMSIAFYKDPSDPAWADDAGLKLHKEIMAKYYPDGNVADAQNIFAHYIAYMGEQSLKAAGKDLTRESLMKAATSLNLPSCPYLLPGITIKTTPTDVRPIRSMQIVQFDGTRYTRTGAIIDARVQ